MNDKVIYLRSAGASLAIDVAGPAPQVIHWGSDLGELDDAELDGLLLSAGIGILHASPDIPRLLSLFPTEYEAWSGTPGIVVARDGRRISPRLRLLRHSAAPAANGQGGTAEVTLADDAAGFAVTMSVALDPAGVLQLTPSIENTGGGTLQVESLLALLPLPARAVECLDFSGKWIRERSPQRHDIVHGTHSRRGRRGKPGLDSPFLLMAGTRGFSSRQGEVWAVHVAWSGDTEWLVEQLPESAGALRSVLGGGELLRQGEIELRTGERYAAPTTYWVHSDRGIDGLSDRFHRHLRSRDGHPRSPRPLTLNTWEAVYFSQNVPHLLELVDRAAEVGVERVVLDDGWFRGRDGARAGLGDWTVDPEKWPDGLQPLVQRIRRHGMQFGLWFEPEMVNLDSALARDHPEWIMGHAAGLGPSSRHQYVLDIAQQAVSDYLLDAVERLVVEYGIDYIKWDHNRDLLEAAGDIGGRVVVGAHAQTVALYRLLDELRRRHPSLEIESCASGGGRVDLGILGRTDRVWASDCNDPVERHSIQRWTNVLVPLELMGSHVGQARAHTTHRVTDEPFRLSTSLFAHAGIEWDLTRCTEQELSRLADWSAMYREFRDLLHSGVAVHADTGDAAASLNGVVSSDGGRGLFEWTQVVTSAAGQLGRIPFPGLSPDRQYRVRVRDEVGTPSMAELRGSPWFDRARTGWVPLPGSVLATAGLPMPALNPAQSVLIECEATDSGV